MTSANSIEEAVDVGEAVAVAGAGTDVAGVVTVTKAIAGANIIETLVIRCCCYLDYRCCYWDCCFDE